MKLSELAGGVRTIPIRFGAHTVRVTYRLGQTTADNAIPFGLPLPQVVPQIIESWDITDDDGTPVPVDEEHCSKIPIAVLRAIVMGVAGDAGLGEASSSSDAG